MAKTHKERFQELKDSEIFDKSRKGKIALAISEGIEEAAKEWIEKGLSVDQAFHTACISRSILGAAQILGISIEDHGEKNSGNFGNTKWNLGWRRRKD